MLGVMRKTAVSVLEQWSMSVSSLAAKMSPLQSQNQNQRQSLDPRPMSANPLWTEVALMNAEQVAARSSRTASASAMSSRAASGKPERAAASVRGAA